MNGNCKQQTIKMPAKKLLQVIKIAFIIKLHECKTVTRTNTVIINSRISLNKNIRVGTIDQITDRIAIIIRQFSFK